MAVYIGGTLVINSSGQVSWSRIINRPSRVTTVNASTTGDNTTVPRVQSLTYTTDTLTIHNDTNCACSTDSSGGGGE